MHEAPHTGPSESLDFFLGKFYTKLEVLETNGVTILARLSEGDRRFEVMDNRIQGIEHSLLTLETDRLAAATALERSAVAAASALERAAANASTALADTQKRRLTRRDGVVIVGAGTLFSSIAVILSHVWDYFSQQMHLHP